MPTETIKRYDFMEKKIEINEKAIIASMATDWDSGRIARAKADNINLPDKFDEMSVLTPPVEQHELSEPPAPIADTPDRLNSADAVHSRRTVK